MIASQATVPGPPTHAATETKVSRHLKPAARVNHATVGRRQRDISRKEKAEDSISMFRGDFSYINIPSKKT